MKQKTQREPGSERDSVREIGCDTDEAGRESEKNGETQSGSHGAPQRHWETWRESQRKRDEETRKEDRLRPTVI